MRAAWDALPGARQRELEGLMIEHSIFASRAKMGLAMSDFANESRKDRPAVVHPLVRTHRRSGRKSLYLASHASHVVGWPIDEGRALLDELIAFATQPQFVYAHRWQEADSSCGTTVARCTGRRPTTNLIRASCARAASRKRRPCDRSPRMNIAFEKIGENFAARVHGGGFAPLARRSGCGIDRERTCAIRRARVRRAIARR